MTCDPVLDATLLACKDAALFQSFCRCLRPRITIEFLYLEPLSDAIEHEHGSEDEATNPENRKPGDCHCQQAADNDADAGECLEPGIEGLERKGLAALITVEHPANAGFAPDQAARSTVGAPIRDVHLSAAERLCPPARPPQGGSARWNTWLAVQSATQSP